MKLFKSTAVVLFASMFVTGVSYAESPECGDPQDDSWMKPEVLQSQLESLGYTIEAMGVSDGNCYQMTGLNGDGQNVTAYFDPRTGGVVQENIIE